MFQRIKNLGTIWGDIKQSFSFIDNRKEIYMFDPNIYINKKIDEIRFNDVFYVIDCFPHDIQDIIRDISIEINSTIKPIDIINLQKEDLFLPENSEEVKKSKKLWEGWLLFLVYMKLHDVELNNIDYEIEANGLKNKLKVLYSDIENDFAIILKHLKCSETFKSRRISHYIFTNQSGRFNPNLLSQSQISKIIPDVTTPLSPTDQKAGKKKFGCFHLEELNQRISSKTTSNDLNKLIKDEIIEVLENAHR